MNSILNHFKTHWQFLIIAFFIVVSTGYLAAQHDDHNDHNGTENWQDEVLQEEFQAGEMIIEHITDSYEWHIMTFGHTHVSIPLPIMFYDQGEFHFFMSSVFHHEKTHDGYFISHNDINAGKLVRLNEAGEEIRPTVDFSFTKNVLAIFISSIIMIWLFTSIGKMYKRNPNQAPKGIQSLLEPLIIFIRDDIAKASIGEKKYKKYLPFLLTLFFFIFLNNLLGLVPFFPGGANVTGNIGVTGVLAVFTFIITTFSANKNYWVHIINTPGVPWWLKIPVPLMPIVELMGVFTKPFVLMVRLFANISAGHIIILGFISLIFIFGEIAAGAGYGVAVVSVSFAIFMNILELLVAFIQAYVFTLLSALYFGMAVEEAHH